MVREGSPEPGPSWRGPDAGEGRGCARGDLADQPPRLVQGRDRGEEVCQLARLALAVGLGLAGDIELDPGPAERPPEQRLDQPNCLDAAVGDGLVALLEEAPMEAQAVGRLADREVEVPVHGAGRIEAEGKEPGRDPGDE